MQLSSSNMYPYTGTRVAGQFDQQPLQPVPFSSPGGFMTTSNAGQMEGAVSGDALDFLDFVHDIQPSIEASLSPVNAGLLRDMVLRLHIDGNQ